MNLFVKHKLELLELLSALLQSEDILLTLVDDAIFLVNLILFLLKLGIQLLDCNLLFVDLVLFLLDDTVLVLNFHCNILELVFGDLQISLGAQFHVSDLIEICLILHLHLVDLEVCILVDLLHSFTVFLLHDLDRLSQVLNLFLLLIDSILVVLLLFGNSFKMLLVDLGLTFTELPGFSLLSLLHSLVTGSIFKHSLRVIVSACL